MVPARCFFRESADPPRAGGLGAPSLAVNLFSGGAVGSLVRPPPHSRRAAPARIAGHSGFHCLPLAGAGRFSGGYTILRPEEELV